MFVFVKRKIQNKKCLNGCLLLGITLLIAVASCTPMFQKGSLNMLLRSKFETVITEQNVYPTVLSRSARVEGEEVFYSSLKEKMSGYLQTWKRYIEVPEKAIQQHIWIDGYFIKREYGLNADWMEIGCIPNMENHIQILAKEPLEEMQSPQEVYSCMMTERVMDQFGLILGERITFEGIVDEDDNPLVLQISGIFDEENATDVFWYVKADEYEKQLFVDEDAMERIIEKYSVSAVNYEVYYLLDYLKINSNNALDILYYLEQFHEKDEALVEGISEVLESYVSEVKFVNTIFWVLELPLFGVLLAFIYMVSGQILNMEKGEISMLGSRGLSNVQIMSIYLYQSSVLAGIGVLLGLPLGFLLCKIAASTDAFLEFSFKSTEVYKPTIVMLVYALIAALFVVAFVTIPVLFYAKDSVVGQKKKRISSRSRSIVEKYWIDVILIICSLYLLYNHNKQLDVLIEQVMMGQYMDPLIFLNVTLFLIGAGLLGLRLLRYSASVVFRFGKDDWKPHTYASFLQIIRADGTQRFISVFLIFTVAMGIFNATVAGTINSNKENRIRYNIGTDIIVSEQWKPQVYMDSNLKKSVRYYVEPDYQKYDGLSSQYVEKMTRVIRDKKVEISGGGKTLENCEMMAIHTKEFGETARLQIGLNDTHWYHYLNDLAVTGSGVLISKNLAEEMELKVGDSIRYTRHDDLLGEGEDNKTSCNGVVCGIFEAWPGYMQYQYKYDENGKRVEQQQYMIVTNYAYTVNVFGDTPYEIWMRRKGNTSLSDVEAYLSDNHIITTSVVGAKEEVEHAKSEAMVQITNGLFTLSFLVSVLLCTIGFLIYWITAIKQRGMLYGIYRAMGMGIREVSKMLLYELSFSSVLSGVFGCLVGLVASLLYTKILAVVYLPEKHNILLQTQWSGIDIMRMLALIVCMVVVCFLVLKRQIRNSDILQAIKMGED